MQSEKAIQYSLRHEKVFQPDLLSTHRELNRLCSFQEKKSKNLLLDHIIPLSIALIAGTSTPKTGLTLL